MAHKLHTLIKKCLHWCIDLFSFGIDSLQTNHRIQHSFSNTLFNKKSADNRYLCIFSQFSFDGNIPDYCHYYLQQLHDAGCDIVLVSTSPTFTEQAISIAKPLCKTIVHRSNTGYDFYSYKVGIELYQANTSNYEKVIIANDSVFGPLRNLDALIHYGDDKKLDFWGASDSHENQYHIQSYFFVFKSHVSQSVFFKNYWANVKMLGNKRHIISRYELSITKAFTEHGYRAGAYCTYKSLVKSARTTAPCNPMLVLWREMLTQHQFPFLKKELVLRNPKNVDLTDLESVVQQHTDYDPSLFNINA